MILIISYFFFLLNNYNLNLLFNLSSFYWIVQIFVLIFAISLPGQSFKSKAKST